MAKKWIALNILLLVAAIGLGRELHQQYERFKTRNDPAKIAPAVPEGRPALKTAPGTSSDASVEAQVYMGDDYSVISEKPLFSDLRGSETPGELTLSVVQPVPPLNPKPLLVSTIMIDGQYVASVIDPIGQRARGAALNTETRRVGDVYRGYTITDIDAGRMVLQNGDPEKGGREEIIQLNRDARRQQPATAVTVAAARVVQIGGGRSSGGVTVMPAAAQPGRTTQTAAQIAARARQQALNQRPAYRAAGTILPNNGGRTPAPENPPSQAQPPPDQPAPQNSNPSNGAQTSPPARRQRVIRTPFGDIIRPGSER